MILIDHAREDIESESITATGPIVVAVTGDISFASVAITCDLGEGEAVAYRWDTGCDTSLARLELPAGSIFKAYVTCPNSDDRVTVSYVFV